MMETKIHDYCFRCLCWPACYYCSGGNQQTCHEKKGCVGLAIDPCNSCLSTIIPFWNVAQKGTVIPELSCFSKMSQKQFHILRSLLEVANNFSWLYSHIFWSLMYFLSPIAERATQIKRNLTIPGNYVTDYTQRAVKYAQSKLTEIIRFSPPSSNILHL